MMFNREVGGVVMAAMAGSILFAPTVGATQSAPAVAVRWPASVTAHVRELDSRCRDEGGTPPRPSSHVKRVDVTGDGIADFVFDNGEYDCGTDLPVFMGNGGAYFQVFVGDAKGGAVLASDGFAPSVRVGVNKSGHTRVIVTFQGAPCGSFAEARADQALCERTLIWNPSTREMRPGPPP